jgi:iron complex outermembrane recepter protein
MMPLNVRIAFDEELKRFTAGIGLQAVDRKSNVDPHRFEQSTPGYALLNAHAGYKRGHFRTSIAAENLTNKFYELPLGGVNFNDYMASMWMAQIKPLTGRGVRSTEVWLPDSEPPWFNVASRGSASNCRTTSFDLERLRHYP